MAHNTHGQSDYDPIPDTGKLYETRDVSISALMKWVVFLFVFVIGSAAASYIVYKIFVPGGEEASQFPMARVRQLPPGPRLQANPVQDIKDYREMEGTALNTYGRDPRTGAIHIPVERAIDLTLQDLPTRPGAGTIDYGKTTAPNAPPQLDGQAEGRQTLPTGANDAPQGMGQPGMNPSQSTMPTSTAPGAMTPVIPGGNNATSGGEPYGPTPGHTTGAAPSGQ